MARMRSLKPEYWADEEIAELPRDARLLYMGLWNLADEHARLRGDARYVKGQLFPYDDDLDSTTVDGLLKILADAGKVVRYVVAGRSYAFLPSLHKHQRLEPERVPSRLPAAPGADASAPGAKDHALSMLHVAGGMEHVAGSMKDAREDAHAAANPTFDDFWDIYPRKASKSDAHKAWVKATKRADPSLIFTAAKRYREDPGRDPKFTAHAATWLNGDRWLDDALPRSRSPNGGYVERDGYRLKPETAAYIDDRAKWEAYGEQRAIEGPT